MPPVMPLPPPPAAAAAQWAQHAYTASTQAAAAKAAAAKAAEVASAQAAAAQAAATQAQVAQVSAQQAAAAQVAQSLGYNVAPVGVPTAAAYGDLPAAAPPYGVSSPNPADVNAMNMGPMTFWLLGALGHAPPANSIALEHRVGRQPIGSTTADAAAFLTVDSPPLLAIKAQSMKCKKRNVEQRRSIAEI